MEAFRVHHILCTNLYQGMGYSGEFCENMTKIVTELRRHPQKELELVCEPDMICQNCPNLTENGGCGQDANHVVGKDEKIRQILGLETHKIYTYQQLCKIALERFTEKDFMESCQNCQWYQQDLCHYDVLQKNLSERCKSFG